MKKSNFGKWAMAVAICEATGIISGLISQTGMNPWFDTLNKPAWNPPSEVFAPVWTLLYLLMGTALWLIWKANIERTQKTQAIAAFAIQLFFNFWWSIIFFRFHEPGWALVDIMFLLVGILVATILFARLSRTAAWLISPYLLWVSFAAFLNYTIWMMNR